MATAAAAAALMWGGGVGPTPPQCRRGREEEKERGEEEEAGVVIPVRPDPNYLVPGWGKRRGEEEGRATLPRSPDWPPQVLKLRRRGRRPL